MSAPRPNPAAMTDAELIRTRGSLLLTELSQRGSLAADDRAALQAINAEVQARGGYLRVSDRAFAIAKPGTLHVSEWSARALLELRDGLEKLGARMSPDDRRLLAFADAEVDRRGGLAQVRAARVREAQERGA